MRNQILKSRRSAEQSLLGGMALASLPAACIRLVLGPAPEVADYLIAVAQLFALFLASLIVMHLVGNTRKQSHGGRLSACSNVGSGATFQFSLPMHQENNTR